MARLSQSNSFINKGPLATEPSLRHTLLSLFFYPSFDFSPVTGLAASFSSVPTQEELKNTQLFFKEAKAAAFRLRSPPAEEAKPTNLKSER